MRHAISILCRIGILAAALFGAGAPVAADTLRMGGVGAATKLLPHLFAAYGHDELDVIPSLGTGGGLRALADGLLDVAVAGRPLEPQELAKGMTQAAAIRTPYGLITSHKTPVSLKSAEIAEIYKAPKATWPDGTPIRIILRPKSDSDTAVLGGMFPNMTAAIEAARQHREVPLAATDQDNAEMAEQMPGSLAGATFTQIKVEKRRVRFVSIDGIEPSLENFERGVYPFAKTLYFVLPPTKNPAAERFLTFLHSPAGETALRAAGSILLAN